MICSEVSICTSWSPINLPACHRLQKETTSGKRVFQYCLQRSQARAMARALLPLLLDHGPRQSKAKLSEGRGEYISSGCDRSNVRPFRGSCRVGLSLPPTGVWVLYRTATEPTACRFVLYNMSVLLTSIRKSWLANTAFSQTATAHWSWHHPRRRAQPAFARLF